MSERYINFHENNNVEQIPKSEIEKMSELLDYPEKWDQYIENRVAELEKTSTKKGINLITNTHNKGYINPQSEVKRVAILRGFAVNDNSAYKTFLESLKLYRDHPNYKDKNIKSYIPNAIQWTIGKYFGNFLADENTEYDNQEFYFEHSGYDSPEEPINLSEFRGKNIGVCVEKSALANNLIIFADANSELLLADCSIEQDKEEGHAYNIITTEKGKFIYDATNPINTYNKDQNTNSYQPALYPISSEQYEQLINNNGKITVEHPWYTIENGNTEVKQKSRVYAGPIKTISSLNRD